ncbi:MAG: RluA family pseudouridine synthase [Saprospiraceae bacterium]|nr:RluA family pseudouridine synthase [Saprospiraceae bacterium]
MHLKILYEDNHLLAVFKPAGSLVQGDKTGDVPIIEEAKSFIKQKYEKPGAVFIGLCHRLDRPVSGVLLLARTSKALSRINHLFATGQVKKEYLAISTSTPPLPQGVVDHWLRKDRKSNRVKYFERAISKSKKAVTAYKLLQRNGSHYLLGIEPATGRSHQIRVALQSIGCSILGDVKYDGQRQADQRSIALHCAALEFVHPVKKIPIRVAANPPDALPWKFFSNFTIAASDMS